MNLHFGAEDHEVDWPRIVHNIKQHCWRKHNKAKNVAEEIIAEMHGI